MKQTAIVFCGSDELAARNFAATIRNSQWITVLASAYEFNRKDYQGRAYIMPDVPRWHADRIAAAYPDFIAVGVKEPLTAKHRGHGRFFVMRGLQIVSGPHSKLEAQGLLK